MGHYGEMPGAFGVHILLCDYDTRSSTERGHVLLQGYKEKEGLSPCSSGRERFCTQTTWLIVVSLLHLGIMMIPQGEGWKDYY